MMSPWWAKLMPQPDSDPAGDFHHRPWWLRGWVAGASGPMAMPSCDGVEPTGTVAMTALVAVSITKTFPSRVDASRRLPEGSIAIPPDGKGTDTAPVAALVAV